MADTSIVSFDARDSRRFIEALDPAREHWAIGAPGLAGGWRWETFQGPLKGPMAERWIAARYAEGVECWLVLGDVSEAVRGPVVPTGAVQSVRLVAAVAAREDAFLSQAAGQPLTVYRDCTGRCIAVWKLAEPLRPTEAIYAAGKQAAECCTANRIVRAQLHYIPLPGDMRPVGVRGAIVRFPMHGRVALPLAGVTLPLGDLDGSGSTPSQFDNATGFLARQIEAAAEKFNVKGVVTSIKVGPVVSVCDFVKEHTTRIDAVLKAAPDIELLIRSKSLLARTDSERGVICFDVANAKRETVFFRDMMNSGEWIEARRKFALPISIGVTVDGTPLFADVAEMPHLLVAGATKSGKSVAMNSMLLSLLTACGPDELRLILIDPKRVEFAGYAGIPHLLAPVANNAERAVAALEWVLVEMNRRLTAMEAMGARDIARYNVKAREAGTATVPRLVVVVDEYGTLMHLAPKQVTAAIARLVAEARAAGIHLILATQHPSAKTVTPPIRANVPARLVFKTVTIQQSAAAIDVADGKKLLDKGDGLLMLDGRLARIHASMATDDEIDACVAAQRLLGAPVYALTFDGVKPLAPVPAEDGDLDDDEGDELGDDAPTRPEKMRPVVRWLFDRLEEEGKTPVLATTIISDGEAAGFDRNAVNRAADAIGVVKGASGVWRGGKVWSLP